MKLRYFFKDGPIKEDGSIRWSKRWYQFQFHHLPYYRYFYFRSPLGAIKLEY